LRKKWWDFISILAYFYAVYLCRKPETIQAKMLQWTEKFETGDSVIDSQHKTLISYINRLEGVSRTTNLDRQEAEFLLNLVDFVELYTAAHFQHEEGCMLRHRCPVYDENKNAHTLFLEFFRNFKRRFETEGCRPEVLRELHDKCSDWIQKHILHIDLQLRPCLGQPSPEEPSDLNS
jgi:hemerythrin